MAKCAKCGETYNNDDHVCVEPGTVRLRPQASAADTDELIERRLGGYVIERVIGKGGMGIVYLASHPVLGKRVAVKVIRSEHAADEELRRRFMDEARTLAALDDPRIVTIQDLALLPDGRAYLVMEYVEGELLSHRLRAGRIPHTEALRITRAILAGLAAAHARGIVHRDIKPSNIVLTNDSVKLLDFGIAKLRDRPGGSATQAGTVVGTPGYMPPEQASARGELGPTADVYAVGVVLFEMLAGKRPFDADTEDDWIEVLVRQRMLDPPPIEGARPPLAAVVRRALAREPGDRYASAAEMLEALGDDVAVAAPRRRRVIGGAIALVGLGAVVAVWQLGGGSNAPVVARSVPRDAMLADVAQVAISIERADASPAAAIPGDAAVIRAVRADAAIAITKSTHTDAAIAVAVPVTPPPVTPPPVTPPPIGARPDLLSFAAPADQSRVDINGYLSTARQLARRIYADADLVEIDAMHVAEDGMSNLSKGGYVKYYFRSPAESSGDSDRCIAVVTVSRTKITSGKQKMRYCTVPFVTPRCTPKQIMAKGAEPDTTLFFKTQSAGALRDKPGWRISKHDLIVADDCGGG